MKKPKDLVVILAVVFLAVVVAFCGYFGYDFVNDDINGNRKTKTEYTLVIEKNDFEYEVGQKLKQNGIIKSDTVWTNWMDKHYPDFTYLNGEYYMNSSMSFEDIVHKLENPDVSHKIVSVCIPEGYNVIDIAKTLEDNGICNSEDFLDACKNASNYSFEFLKSVPNNPLIAYQLEGFLFPATYELGMNSEPKDVINYMLETFEEHITTEMEEYCQKNSVTLFELINLASIVQKEAFSIDSARNIASVFVNRLNKGAKLQSDVTYFYAAKLRDEHGFSQEVYDSYYTYRRDGLPSGPIANCGDDIVKAVVEHPDTDYLYFFSDLQNEFHFAKTGEEFNELLQKYPWQ